MRNSRSGWLLAKALSGIVYSMLAPFPNWTRTYALARFIEENTPVYEVATARGALKILCPGSNPADRAYRFFEKEADTIAWLDTMTPRDLLWDVGANIGCYSLYAAMKGCQVVAFEPEAANFWLLTRNIDLNGLSDKITPINAALSDRTDLFMFGIDKIKIGGAAHPGVGRPGKTLRTAMTFRADDFKCQYWLRPPTHIKIDVDGHELAVLAGLGSLAGQARSIQIEVRESTAEAAQAMLKNLGFAGRADQWPLLRARSGSATNFRFDRMA